MKPTALTSDPVENSTKQKPFTLKSCGLVFFKVELFDGILKTQRRSS